MRTHLWGIMEERIADGMKMKRVPNIMPWPWPERILTAKMMGKHNTHCTATHKREYLYLGGIVG